ncbi:uncharacterized protein CLUP02_13449 [Colletotrichum lupini]|uniref:Uncharacterized protein n=1 Tax=Colletotrichum lupini TaxID=145971 RepID=A0A9Q8T2F4_9PEZI|nr:uncharacterized protein CLUP02_13449 [Colletotrichum lupini]UQC87928.1 hypothetical protein CLUP02_13449 [Colletotrichum lupini]
MAAVYGRRGLACAERESEKCDTLTCRRLPVNVAWQRTEATTGLERRTCRVGDRTCRLAVSSDRGAQPMERLG